MAESKSSESKSRKLRSSDSDEDLHSAIKQLTKTVTDIKKQMENSEVKLIQKIENKIEDEIESGLQKFKEEIQSDLKNYCKQLIHVSQASISSRIEKVEEEQKTVITIVNEHHETMANELKNIKEDDSTSHLTARIAELEQKVEFLEDQMRHVKDLDPLEDTNITIVASNVSETLLSSVTDAERIIAELHLEHTIKVIKAKRLPNRKLNTLALLKFSVNSIEQKIAVLKAKAMLKNARDESMREVSLRTSKTHAELSTERNTRMMLEITNSSDNWYVNGNGKRLKRTQPNQHRRGNGMSSRGGTGKRTFHRSASTASENS